jgi:exosortase A
MNAHPGAKLPTAWRHVLPPLALLLLLLLLVYRDTAAAMVTIWARSDTFAHAFLVPPITAWLIWRQRARLATAVPRPAAWVLLLVIGAGVVWLLGDLGAANSITQLAFTTLLVLAVPALVGLEAARAMLFPLCFLFFAVPIGEFVMPQLMIWTADFTALALRVSGIPVYRDGLQLVIPSGTWHIVEACSGVRYLIASLMVGTLFAYLNFQSLRKRLIFVGVSILVPILANWMRAYLIVLAGHVSNNQVAVGVDHLIYGWVFFGIVMMLLFIIGGRFAERASPAMPSPSTRPAAVQSAVGSSALRPWVVAAAGAALGIAPALAARALETRQPASVAQLALPATLSDGWKLVAKPVTDWKPSFKNPSTEINATYESKGRQVGVYVGYYRQQSVDHKLVSSDNVLVDTKDGVWTQSASGTSQLRAGAMPIEVRTANLRAKAGWTREDGLLVWQVYWVNGRFTSSDLAAKAYGVVYRLLGRGDDSAVVILYADQEPAGGGRAALESFARANLMPIGDWLSTAREDARMTRNFQ